MRCAGGKMTLSNRQSLGLLRILLLMSVLLLMVVVAGCAPNASAHLISPQLGAQLYAEEANSVVQAEPTPVPRLFTELAPEEVTAGLPDDFAAALAAADPSNGEKVALVNGCGGCHSTDPAVTMTGPTWHNVADTATNRVAGESPALYIHDSIVNPGGFVVPNYPDGVMPRTFAETIPMEDLADLVAYLLTLHE
jgi:cytochrome c551/c552